MLKTIATACNECTTKHERKASYNQTKNLLVFSMNFLNPIWKKNILAISISYEKPKPNSILAEFCSYKILRNILIKHIFYREATSVSLF